MIVWCCLSWGCATSTEAPLEAAALTAELPQRGVAPDDALAFYHPASGMVFPRQVAGFASHAVHHYDHDGNNVSVGYRPSDDNLIIHATVQVYPLSDAAGGTLQHFEDNKDVILSQRPGTRLIAQGEIQLPQGQDLVSGRRAHFLIENSDSVLPMQISHLFLFEHGEWLIKYRMMFMAFQHAEADAAVMKFMRALRLPTIRPTVLAGWSRPRWR